MHVFCSMEKSPMRTTGVTIFIISVHYLSAIIECKHMSKKKFNWFLDSRAFNVYLCFYKLMLNNINNCLVLNAIISQHR